MVGGKGNKTFFLEESGTEAEGGRPSPPQGGTWLKDHHHPFGLKSPKRKCKKKGLIEPRSERKERKNRRDTSKATEKWD